VKVALAGMTAKKVASAEVLTGTDPKMANSFEEPDKLVPTGFEPVTVSKSGDAVTMKLPAMAFAAVSVQLG
jgi:alpha-L-arabinofuranosidase